MVEALGYRIQSESHEEALARTTLDGASATCREGMTMTETTSRGAHCCGGGAGYAALEEGREALSERHSFPSLSSKRKGSPCYA
jgi:hypothetical protein